MVYNERSSGSSNWNRARWPVSLKMTAPGTLPISSKFTPNCALQQSQSNPSLYGWKVSSWDHLPPPILLLKPRGSSTIGASTLTYSNLGSWMHRGKRQRGRNISGRHVQTLLHLPKICARVVWKRPIVHTNLVCSRTWVPSAEEHSLPAEAAAPLPLCVDATM